MKLTQVKFSLMIVIAQVTQISSCTLTRLEMQAQGSLAGDFSGGFIALLGPPKYWLSTGVIRFIGDEKISDNKVMS